jgi:methylated-DNA-[protein]-cysteine S-methyltransferase
MTQPRFEAQALLPSPLGALTVAATARGLALLWFDGQQHRTPTVDAPLQPEHPMLLQAAAELESYWADSHTPFRVPLDPAGTAFQQSVWQVLRGIAPGHLMRYAEVARCAGRPTAARAVGAAIGRNPLSIIVPCHRVVGSDGSLTGYAGGMPRKAELLRREGAYRNDRPEVRSGLVDASPTRRARAAAERHASAEPCP